MRNAIKKFNTPKEQIYSAYCIQRFFKTLINFQVRQKLSSGNYRFTIKSNRLGCNNNALPSCSLRLHKNRSSVGIWLIFVIFSDLLLWFLINGFRPLESNNLLWWLSVLKWHNQLGIKWRTVTTDILHIYHRQNTLLLLKQNTRKQ